MNKSKDKMKVIIIAGVACVAAIAVIALAVTSLSGGSVKAADGAVPAVRTSESVNAAESEAAKKAEEAKETEADVATSLKDQIDYNYLQNALAYIDMTYSSPSELKDEDYSGYPALVTYLQEGLATRAGLDGKDYIEESAEGLPQIIEDDQFQTIVDPNSDLTAEYSYGYTDVTYKNTCFDKFMNLVGCEGASINRFLEEYYKGGSYRYDVESYTRQIFSEVEMGTVEKDKNAVYVHYKFIPDVTDSDSEEEYRVAVIVPAKNSLGYEIQQITEDNGDVSYYVTDKKKDDDDEDETETDIYGNVIEKETDEEETDIYGNVIEKETDEEETDIYGNVIDDDEDDDEDEEDEEDEEAYYTSSSSSSGSGSGSPFGESSSSGGVGFNGSFGHSHSNSSSSSSSDDDDDIYSSYYGYGYYGY